MANSQISPSRLKDGKTYQGTTLQNFNDRMLQSCKSQALADLKQLDSSMRDRLEWTDVEILRNILVFLDTNSWRCPVSDSTNSQTAEKDEVLAKVQSAVEYISTSFREPLEAKGVALHSLQDEMEEVVEYARKYLCLDRESYRKIWYKLHICPNANTWPNVLLLCELGFSLPFSNGRVEFLHLSSLRQIEGQGCRRVHSAVF